VTHGGLAAPPLSAASRLTVQAAIKQLESAAASILDPAMSDVRDSLLKQAGEKKKLLQVSKPVGQRLDNARAALERTSKRLASAQQTLLLAHATVDAAQEEYDGLSVEVSQLESSIGPGVPGAASDVMSGLRDQLVNALAHLNECDGVTSEIAGDAKSHSEALFLKFQATLNVCQEQAKVVQASAKLRHTSKTAPTAGRDFAKVRHTGKAAPLPLRKGGVRNFFSKEAPGRLQANPGAGLNAPVPSDSEDLPSAVLDPPLLPPPFAD